LNVFLSSLDMLLYATSNSSSELTRGMRAEDSILEMLLCFMLREIKVDKVFGKEELVREPIELFETSR